MSRVLVTYLMSRVLVTYLMMALCLTYDSQAWQPAGYMPRPFLYTNGPGCIDGVLVCPELPPDINNRCPTVDPPMPKVMENEADCSSYYECQDGIAVLLCCSHDQYWDTPMNTCDDLQHVDCGTRPPVIESCLTDATTTSTTITTSSTTLTLTTSTTTSTSTSTSTSTTSTTTTTVPGTVPPPIDEKCSSYNGLQPLYIPDESNCHHGWKCDGIGSYITIICPSQGGEQLVFNPILGTCDFPWHYPCDNHLMPRFHTPLLL